MRRISLLSLVGLFSVSFVFSTNTPVKAVAKTIFVGNTTFSTNKGLTFCGETNTKGCIDSISIDGNVLTPSTNYATSDYFVGGGVYSTPCRFLETVAASCEAPYMMVYPRRGAPGNPTGSEAVGEVTINFRRQPGDDPTARVGALISNGAVKSFTPAAPGLRDVATIVVSPTTTFDAMKVSSSCSGWAPTIDLCDIPEKATSVTSNRVVVFLLPGFRNSIVPPEELLDGCVKDLANNCLVNVFDPTSLGGWMDTDASIFGLSSTDRLTGAAQLKIAGPHYQMDQTEEVSRTPNPCPNIPSICAGRPQEEFGYTINTIVKNTEPILNLSVFRAFIPSGYLMNSFGLTPSQVNATSLPVRRTTTADSTSPETTYTPVEGGIQINTTGIGFSVPTISMSRVLTVKKGSKISATSLIKAAGLIQAKKFGPITIGTSKKKGITKLGKNYRFVKKNTVTLSLKYKSNATSPITTRTLQVIVK